jgi:hypothetical protein
VLIVDSLLISGIKFVLSRLAEAVEAEMYDETALREELLAAQMKLELEEIDEEEFAQIEEQVLRGLREVAERKKSASRAGAGAAEEPEAKEKPAGETAKIRVESVEAEFGHQEQVSEKS